MKSYCMMKGCVPIWLSYDAAPLYTSEPSGSKLAVESLHYMTPLTHAVHQRCVCLDWAMYGLSGPHLAYWIHRVITRRVKDSSEGHAYNHPLVGWSSVCPPMVTGSWHDLNCKEVPLNWMVRCYYEVISLIVVLMQNDACDKQNISVFIYT